MKAVLTRERPTIFGDGEQSRDFTYVEDVTALVIKAAGAPGVSGRVYNAGNGNRYTLNEVWETLQKIEGVSIPARYGPPRAGDVRDSQADTRAARARPGARPAIQPGGRPAPDAGMVPGRGGRGGKASLISSGGSVSARHVSGLLIIDPTVNRLGSGSH